MARRSSFVVLVLAFAVGACRRPDLEVRSPDGRFVMELTRGKVNLKGAASASEAELYGLFGLSCGRGQAGYGRGIDLAVQWSESQASVNGIAGVWDLEHCRFKPGPETTY